MKYINPNTSKLLLLLINFTIKAYLCWKKSTRTMMNSFPHDIHMLIFLKLTFEDLFRCKSICKSWFNIIHSPCFSYLHLKKGQVETFPLAVNCKLRDYDFHLLEEDEDHTNNALKEREIRPRRSMEAVESNFDIVGSCNGLICIKDGETLNIVNPFYSKVIKKIPLPSPFFQRAEGDVYPIGFGFDESTNMFKIVVPFRYKVFWCDNSLGSSSWKELSPLARYPGPAITFCRRPPLFVDGVLYWMIKTDKSWVEILSFDLNTEVFDVIPPPVVTEQDFSCFDLFDFHGDVGMANLCGSGVTVWKFLKIHDRKYKWVFIRIEWPCNYPMIDSHYLITNVVSGESIYLPRMQDCKFIQCHRGSLIHTSRLVGNCDADDAKDNKAEQLKTHNLSNVISKPEPIVVAQDEEVDETGLVPWDIEILMREAGFSRAHACIALKAEFDIVFSILFLVGHDWSHLARIEGGWMFTLEN